MNDESRDEFIFIAYEISKHRSFTFIYLLSSFPKKKSNKYILNCRRLQATEK